MLKPLATIDEIAYFEVNTYWGSIFGEHNGPELPHHFPTNNLTYNIDALTPHEQALARAALQTWADVCNISFSQVSGSALITFRDDQPGGTAAATFPNGITTSVTINISKTDFATAEIGNNGFIPYLHEIGHALGLGHSGPYAGQSTYSANVGSGDNIYLNDTYNYTVMSYFSAENYTGPARAPTTPMPADIAGVISIYGASQHTRLDNTTYGFNSNAGDIFDFNKYGLVAISNTGPPQFTIVDDGGIDTIDTSGYSVAQTIDLRPGNYSSIGGQTNNIAIWRTTIIENAIGGTGADTIIGNDARNAIAGGGGNDTIDGGGDIDTAIYRGNRSSYSIHTTGAATTISGASDGTDTLTNVERVQFADSAVALDVQGNAGNAYRLYQAAFNRTPDTAGLSFWVHALDQGVDIQVVAAGFVNAAEFKTVYGTNPSNAHIVDLMYQNVLGRAGEPAGINFWVGQLNNGLSIGALLEGFAVSSENHGIVDPKIAQGIVLDHTAFLV